MLGKTNEPVIIVDADALISFVYVGDANHHRAKAIMAQLAPAGCSFLFPTTAICEAVTVLRGRLNRPEDAGLIVKKFQDSDFPVQAVDQEALFDAARMYNPQTSKKNTLFDAVIAALAKRLHADAIFSFDGWYRKIGLKLTDDLISQNEHAA